MKLILSPVTKASIIVESPYKEESIEKWLLIYVCVEKKDQEREINTEKICEKILSLRLFHSERNDKIDTSLRDFGGEILLVSNFTLAGRNKKGNAMDFLESGGFEFSKSVYEALITQFEKLGIFLKTWTFWAKMEITSVNSWPLNYILEF